MNPALAALTPGASVATTAARVSVAPPRGRLSLRARAGLDALEAALGLPLPARIGRRTQAGELEAIRLGPDEWTLTCPSASVAGMEAACAAIYATHTHSLVDISGREVSILVEGPRAAELLTLGCAREIEAIPVGEGRRTLFDGATVVLRRDSADRFRLDAWRSFAPHLLHLLETGCRELAAEMA